MPGLFNVQNAMAALAVCVAVGGAGEQYAFAGLMKARVRTVGGLRQRR